MFDTVFGLEVHNKLVDQPRRKNTTDNDWLTASSLIMRLH